jgi:tetratricopeptide (TPR) repeat protein
MPLDVYEPCPCGSGKKLKFCCHAIAGEMERIARLEENNQVRPALHALEQLERSHPGNPWVLTHRAGLLIEEGDNAAAQQLLGPYVESHPDQVFALMLYATAALRADGFEKAKSAIHRALQRGRQEFPSVVGSLAFGIAAEMAARGKAMAARQYLVLALQSCAESARQTVFVRLLEMDSETSVPYPLRSVHELANYSGTEENEVEFKKAARLSGIGCFAPAARRFAKLAEQEPENAALWNNVGLCRAWDGDHAGAAEALHRAARLHGEFGMAVECETIAQLLELTADENVISTKVYPYRITTSVSRLLTKLDSHERFGRIPIPPAEPDSDEDFPVAGYHIFQRAASPEPSTDTPTADVLTSVLGGLTIYDAAGDQPAKAYVNALEGETAEAIRTLLQSAAGEDLEPIAAEVEEPLPVGSVPRDYAFLQADGNWFVPPKVPSTVRRRLEREKWWRIVADGWANKAFSALNGRTPREAAGDPELKLPLTAGLYVLDALIDQDRYVLDLPAVCDFVHVELPPLIEVADSASMNAYSAVQLLRVPIERLTDPQLVQTLNRALLIRHKLLLYKVLREAVSRPGCLEKIDVDVSYSTLVQICREQDKRDEAFQWLEKGRAWAKTQEKAFEATLQWELRELFLRAEDPNDPNLPPLLKRIWDYYGVKLPQLRERLAALVEIYGIPAPWDTTGGAGVAAAFGAPTTGGIWQPSDPPAQSGQKLWIPGQ